jgi:hypothetical protein
MVLGSAQPLTEMSTRNISLGEGLRWPVLRNLNLLEPSESAQACNGIEKYKFVLFGVSSDL